MLLCHFYDIKRSVAEKRIIFFILLFFAEPTQHILSAELLRTFYQCCGSKFKTFVSGSKILFTRIQIQDSSNSDPNPTLKTCKKIKSCKLIRIRQIIRILTVPNSQHQILFIILACCGRELQIIVILIGSRSIL